LRALPLCNGDLPEVRREKVEVLYSPINKTGKEVISWATWVLISVMMGVKGEEKKNGGRSGTVEPFFKKRKA